MKNSQDIKEQIVKNGFWGIISSILNRFGSFILIILISRLLMPEGFGKYSLAMTLSLLFITLSDMGINQTLIRHISLEFDKNKKKAAAYFKYLLRIRLLLTLIASLIFLISAYPFSFYIFKEPQLFPIFIIMSLYIFFTSLMSFFESLFFVKKNVKYISLKEFFYILFKLGAILFVWFFIIPQLQLFSIFVLFVCLSILAFLFTLYLLKKRHSFLFQKTNFLFEKTEKKNISKFIFFLNLQNISLIILSNINIILLGIFANSESVGYYNSAWALINGIIGFLFSVSYLFLPIFTQIDKDRFKNLLKKVFRLFFILAFPISFGLALLSKFFIFFIYGESYLLASVPLAILAFIIPCIMGIDLSLASFSAKNKQKKFSIILFISVLISSLITLLLIKLLSVYSGKIILIGISIATLITWASCFISAILLIKKQLNVNIIDISLLKVLISCFSMSLFIFFITKLFPEINLFFGILIILFSSGIYFISLYFMKGITKDDIIMIKQLIKRKKINSSSMS